MLNDACRRAIAAVVILCGLVTSTLLNMAVVPALYLRFARPATGAAGLTQ
jgi:Cu/Ag efflux pump CusA